MDNYLYGYRVHKLDAKSRVAIPAHMRGRLGEEFVASLGLGDFVALYPQDQWEALLEQVQNSTLSGEKKKSLDSQGRILLSDRLKNKVNLAGEKEAVVFGNINHIEIWNSTMFEEQVSSIDKNEVIEIMDELNGIGI